MRGVRKLNMPLPQRGYRVRQSALPVCCACVPSLAWYNAAGRRLPQQLPEAACYY